MKVKIKIEDGGKMPTKAHKTDAGFDLYAAELNFKADKGYVEYDTKVRIEVPEGHVGFIFPRSSISNLNLILTNSVGVIDHGYSGTIKFRFKKSTLGKGMYEVGDRIGQMIIMPYPQIEFVEGDLEESDRGEGGFGSSGE